MSTDDSTLSHGTSGSPQTNIEEQIYPSTAKANETESIKSTYSPSPKHETGHNWGSENPIKNNSEGQELLDSGYHDGKQIYNVTSSGIIVKFQPDNTPGNGYHSYGVSKPRDIPSGILKQMLADGKITKADYNRLRKGKK